MVIVLTAVVHERGPRCGGSAPTRSGRLLGLGRILILARSVDHPELPDEMLAAGKRRLPQVDRDLRAGPTSADNDDALP